MKKNGNAHKMNIAVFHIVFFLLQQSFQCSDKVGDILFRSVE